MIEATMNQLNNVSNPAQTDKRKVLCVCSAGLLRSPTLANVLHQELGYNTRACGSVKSFALIPITEALIRWADEIVFVDFHCYNELDSDEENLLKDKKIVVLDIPDRYRWKDPQMKKDCFEQYCASN